MGTKTKNIHLIVLCSTLVKDVSVLALLRSRTRRGRVKCINVIARSNPPCPTLSMSPTANPSLPPTPPSLPHHPLPLVVFHFLPPPQIKIALEQILAEKIKHGKNDGNGGGGQLFSLITFIDGSLSSLQVDTSPAITFAARQPTGRCLWGQKNNLKEYSRQPNSGFSNF